jgi:uncharacterized iron-regulated membrane protein
MPGIRALLFRVHWALGLTAGLILGLMGLTGALLSYEDAILGWANGDRTVVAVREAPRLSPAALAARVEAQGAGHRIARLTVRDDPAASVVVRFDRDPASRERPASLYADPYDGTVLGEVRGDRFYATVLNLHRWLLLPGEARGWGRTITGICAFALLAFLVTGIVLRWPKVHRWRIWLKPSLSRPGRPRWWSLHAVAGTWLLPVYAIIALSGLTWSFDWFKDGANRLLVGQPVAMKRMGARPPAEGAGPPALDAAWNAFAEGEGRGYRLAQILVPEEGRQPIRIRWFARDEADPAKRNEARYEAATGALLSAERAAEQPLGKRIAGNMLEVHRGRFFGEGFALLFCLAALAMPGFAATGLTLYILRRRAAGRRRADPRITKGSSLGGHGSKAPIGQGAAP